LQQTLRERAVFFPRDAHGRAVGIYEHRAHVFRPRLSRFARVGIHILTHQRAHAGGVALAERHAVDHRLFHPFFHIGRGKVFEVHVKHFGHRERLQRPLHRGAR
jgi:hypothetical protein